jgi:hypothetical protein
LRSILTHTLARHQEKKWAPVQTAPKKVFIDELVSKNSDEQTLRQMELQLATQNEELRKLKADLANATIELTALRSTVQTQRQALREFKEKPANRTSTPAVPAIGDKTMQWLEQNLETKRQLESQVSSLTQNKLALEREQVKMEAAYAAMGRQLELANQRFDSISQQSSSPDNQKVQQLQEAKQQLETQIAKLQQEKRTNEAAATNLCTRQEKEVALLVESQRQLNIQLSQLQEEKRVLEAATESAQSRQDQVTLQSMEVKMQLESEIGDLSHAKAALERDKAKLELWVESKRHLESQAAAARNMLEAQVSRLQQDKLSLKQDKARLEAAHSELEKQLDLTTRQLELTELTAENFQALVDQSRVGHVERTGSAHELLVMQRQLEKQVSSLEEENSNLNQEKTDLVAQLGALVQQLELTERAAEQAHSLQNTQAMQWLETKRLLEAQVFKIDQEKVTLQREKSRLESVWQLKSLLEAQVKSLLEDRTSMQLEKTRLEEAHATALRQLEQAAESLEAFAIQKRERDQQSYIAMLRLHAADRASCEDVSLLVETRSWLGISDEAHEQALNSIGPSVVKVASLAIKSQQTSPSVPNKCRRNAAMLANDLLPIVEAAYQANRVSLLEEIVGLGGASFDAENSRATSLSVDMNRPSADRAQEPASRSSTETVVNSLLGVPFKPSVFVAALRKVPGSIKEGYLSKKGEIYTAFQRRYFVLMPTEILYYKVDSDPKPRGVLPLGNKCEVCEHFDKGDLLGFHLISDGKSTMLAASSPGERQSWVAALRELFAWAVPVSSAQVQQVCETFRLDSGRREFAQVLSKAIAKLETRHAKFEGKVV